MENVLISPVFNNKKLGKVLTSNDEVNVCEVQAVNTAWYTHEPTGQYLLTHEGTWSKITWSSCTAASYSPSQSTRSYSCGDSPAARGENSSISASPASRRSPSLSNRHWRQNCRLEQRSTLLASLKMHFLVRSCFPPVVHLQRIGLCAAILNSLETTTPQKLIRTSDFYQKKSYECSLTFWALPRFTNSRLRERKWEDNEYYCSKVTLT